MDWNNVADDLFSCEALAYFGNEYKLDFVLVAADKLAGFLQPIMPNQSGKYRCLPFEKLASASVQTTFGVPIYFAVPSDEQILLWVFNPHQIELRQHGKTLVGLVDDEHFISVPYVEDAEVSHEPSV